MFPLTSRTDPHILGLKFWLTWSSTRIGNPTQTPTQELAEPQLSYEVARSRRQRVLDNFLQLGC